MKFEIPSIEKIKSYAQNHPKEMRIYALVLLVAFGIKLFFILFTFGINPTHSISEKYVLIHRHAIPCRNEIIVFKQPSQPIHPPTTQFVKFLRGLPGDTVRAEGNDIFINGQKAATAIDLDTSGKSFSPLGFSGVIPPHKYLALGTSLDSFDSRYDAFGLVDESNIIGSGPLAWSNYLEFPVMSCFTLS